jgi:hypothetical protein
MGKQKKDKGRLPPFVPLHKATMESKAWMALSHGARCLFIALSGEADNHHYSAYLSRRDASNKVGACRQKIREWFAELEHYGFIVMLRPGCLGSDGHGKATLWRITDRGTTRGGFETPTQDFLRWNGTLFDPKPYRRGSKWSENPGQHVLTRVVNTSLPCGVNTSLPPNGEGGQHVVSIPEDGRGQHVVSITRLTTGEATAGTSLGPNDPRVIALDATRKALRSKNGQRS